MEYRVSYFFQTALFEMSYDTPGHTPHIGFSFSVSVSFLFFHVGKFRLFVPPSVIRSDNRSHFHISSVIRF